jgi:ABC-type sulfate transport system permease subunit
VLCFAKALGEFGATITFVANIPGETQTISAAIYTFTQIPATPPPAAWCWSFVIALRALVEWLGRAACASTENDDARGRRENGWASLDRGALNRGWRHRLFGPQAPARPRSST